MPTAPCVVLLVLVLCLAGCGGDTGFGDEDVEFVVEVAGHRTSVKEIYRILQETLLVSLAT